MGMKTTQSEVIGTTKDIFQKIAERDAVKKAPKAHNVVRYAVSCNGRWSRKYYTRRAAQKLIKRAARMGADVYMSPVSATEWR